MHIYLKKGEALNKLTEVPKNGLPLLSEKLITEAGTGCYLVLSDDSDVPEELKEVFLRASIQDLPNYHKLSEGRGKRAYGVYRLGNAEAELIPHSNSNPYKLILATNCWDGLKNMKTLQRRLWAGTIAPDISYDKEQERQHLFQVLREILSVRKLNLIQRFFLAMRLVVSK